MSDNRPQIGGGIPEEGRLLVDVTIKTISVDGEPVRSQCCKALIDTGTTITLMEPFLVGDLGLGDAKSQATIRCIGNPEDHSIDEYHLNLAVGNADDVPVSIGVLETQQDDAPIVLGLDVLRTMKLLIDGHEGRFWVEP